MSKLKTNEYDGFEFNTVAASGARGNRLISTSDQKHP